MYDRSTCPYYKETDSCIDCYIEHCPACCNSNSENNIENTRSEKPALLIFRCLNTLRPDRMHEVRDKLINQIKEGIVLLPAYMTVEAIVPADCEIRIVDKDGNIVEGGKAE